MIALKEWAIICKALEDGKQILLLRKGGIMEYRKGFEVKHNEFLLYPTFEHQSLESIKAEYKEKLKEILEEQNKYTRKDIDIQNSHEVEISGKEKALIDPVINDDIFYESVNKIRKVIGK